MAAVPTAVTSALDGHQQLADELKVKIDEPRSGVRGAEDMAGGGGADELRPYATFRERLAHLVHSYRYQVCARPYGKSLQKQVCYISPRDILSVSFIRLSHGQGAGKLLVPR